MKKLIIPPAIWIVSWASLSAQQAQQPDPAKHRELIRQWVKTEQLIGEEKSAWKVEKQRLQTLLDLYQKELKLLDEEISKAGKAAGKIDQQKQQLEKNLNQFRLAEQTLKQHLGKLLPRLRKVATLLPAPLRLELATDIDILSADDTLAQPRETLKAAISLLSNAARFNRSVTLNEETRDADGKKMTVQVLYLGLSRAYYAAKAGDFAGVGSPAANSWSWESKPELATAIRKAIAVYNKDQQPQLIELPLKLASPVSSSNSK